jgi:hypothetical protein
MHTHAQKIMARWLHLSAARSLSAWSSYTKCLLQLRYKRAKLRTKIWGRALARNFREWAHLLACRVLERRYRYEKARGFGGLRLIGTCFKQWVLLTRSCLCEDKSAQTDEVKAEAVRPEAEYNQGHKDEVVFDKQDNKEERAPDYVLNGQCNVCVLRVVIFIAIVFGPIILPCSCVSLSLSLSLSVIMVLCFQPRVLMHVLL